eukprot:scaffold25166_cov79-Cyclotella_meneghiniana.AAC.6
MKMSHIFISSLNKEYTNIDISLTTSKASPRICITRSLPLPLQRWTITSPRSHQTNSSWPKPKHTIQIGTQTQTNKSLPTVHESSLTFSIKHSRENIDEKRRHIIQNEKEKGGR